MDLTEHPRSSHRKKFTLDKGVGKPCCLRPRKTYEWIALRVASGIYCTLSECGVHINDVWHDVTRHDNRDWAPGAERRMPGHGNRDKVPDAECRMPDAGCRMHGIEHGNREWAPGAGWDEEIC